MKKVIALALVVGTMVLSGCGKDKVPEDITFGRSSASDKGICRIDKDGGMSEVAKESFGEMAYLGDDKYVCRTGTELVTYDLKNGESVSIWDSGDMPLGAEVYATPDHQYVYFAAEDKDAGYTIQRYSLADEKAEIVLKGLEHDVLKSPIFVSEDLERIYFYGSGERKYAQHMNYQLVCYDRQAGFVTLAEDVVCFDVSGDESFLVFTRADDKRTEFVRLDLGSGEEEVLYEIKKFVSDLDVSGTDGSTFLYVTYRLDFFNQKTGEKIYTYNIEKKKSKKLYSFGMSYVLTGICWDE